MNGLQDWNTVTGRTELDFTSIDNKRLCIRGIDDLCRFIQQVEQFFCVHQRLVDGAIRRSELIEGHIELKCFQYGWHIQ